MEYLITPIAFVGAMIADIMKIMKVYREILPVR